MDASPGVVPFDLAGAALPPPLDPASLDFASLDFEPLPGSPPRLRALELAPAS